MKEKVTPVFGELRKKKKFMNNYSYISIKEFWEQVDKIKIREFVISILCAAKFQVEHSRALNLSKKVKMLLNNNNAGQEYDLIAKMHYQRRNSYLLTVKKWLIMFIEKIDENQKIQFEEFFSQGQFKEFLTYNRQSTILRLLNSECVSYEDSTMALKQLDIIFEKLEKLRSLDDIHNYLKSHIDEIIEKKIGNELPSGLCIIILVISSFFAVLVLIALIICILSFGFLCDINLMLDNICGA